MTPRLDISFSGGVADGLLLPDTPVEEGAAPGVWKHPNGEAFDVYVHAPDMSTASTWVYVFARTEAPR